MKTLQLSTRWLLVLLCIWSAGTALAQTYVSALESGKVYRITARDNTGTALTDNGGANLVGSRDWTGTSYETLWTVTASGDGYTVKNVFTGRYMQGVNGSGTQATMSATEVVCYLPGTGSDTYFNILPSADGAYSLNLYGGSSSTIIKGWNKGTDDSDTGSQWQFAEVENVPTGLDLAVTHGYIRIVSGRNTANVITASNGELHIGEKSSSIDYNQIWKIAKSEDETGYILRSVSTGKYVNTNRTDYAVQPLGADPVTLYINVVTDIADRSDYVRICISSDLTNTEKNFFHDDNNGKVVTWSAEATATASTWKIEMASINKSTADASLALSGLLEKNYGLVRIATTSDGKVLTDTNGEMLVADPATDYSQGNNWNQVWLMQSSGEGYTLRNLATGNYPQTNCDHYKPALTSETSYPIYVRQNPYDEAEVNYNISINSTNFETGWQTLQYVADYNGVQRWVIDGSGGYGGIQPNCGFTFEAVEGISANQMRAQLDKLSGVYSTPETGKIFRIVNTYHTDNFIVLDETTGQLKYTSSSDSYSQYWELASEDGVNFTIKNVLTGQYVQKGTSPYGTGTSANGTFAITPTTPYLSICTIGDSNGKGLHASGSNVINWSTEAGASRWRFEEITLTEEDWTAIRGNATNKATANLEESVNFGLVRIATDREDGKVLADVSGAVKLVVPDAADKTQLWVMAMTDNGQYTFRNWSTGKYIDCATGVSASMNTTSTAQASKVVIASSSTEEKSLYKIYHPNTNANGWYYDGTDENLQIAATAEMTLGVAFSIEPAMDVQPVTPEAGKYYRIQNVARPGFIVVNESNQLSKVTESEDLSQYWQVVTTDGATCALRNAYTGQYVQKAAAAEDRYTTGAVSVNFTLEVKTALPYYKEYYITDENAEGLHAMTDGGVIRYANTDAASVWCFEEVTLTEEQKTTIESQPHNRLYAALNANHGLVRLYSGRTATKVAVQNGTQMKIADGDAEGTTTPSQIWQIVTLTDGSYKIRSMSTGKYLEGYKADYAALNLVDEGSTFYIKGSTIDGCTDNFFISSTSDYSGHTCLHDDNNGKVVGWDTNDGASTWNIVAATDADYEALEGVLTKAAAMAELPAALTHNGLVRITTDRANGYVISDAGKNNGYKLTLAAPNEEDLSQVWIMSGSGNNYTFRNVATGRYIDRTETKFTELATVTASTTHYVNGALVSTEGNPLFNISHPDATDVCWFHRSADDLLITSSTDATPGSAFRFTAATDVTMEEVRVSLYEAAGWSVPETGKYYYIYNGYWSSTQGRTDEIITEADGKLTTAAVSSTNQAQVWQLTSTDGTNFSFKNLSTNNYIQSQTTDVGQYATGSSAVTFPVGISANLSATSLEVWYNITDTDGDALKMENHTVVNNKLNNEIIQSYWRFKEVDINSFSYTTEHNIKTLDQLINDHNGIVMVRSVRNGALSKVMAPKADASGLHLETLADNLTDETNWNQVWILQRTNSASPYTYTFRNLGSGEYIKEGLALGDDKHNFYIKESTNTTGTFNIAKSNTFDGATHNSFNEQSSGIGWWWAQNDTGSDWYIEPVEGITWEQVKQHLGIPTYSAPESGKYYKIVSRAYGHVITAKTGSAEIQGQEYANFPSQWWKITVNGSNYTFQNAATNTYIQGDPGTSTVFKLGASSVNFALTQTDDHYGIYAATGNEGRGLHESSSQDDNIVSWNYSGDASRWYFEEVTLSAAEIEAQVAVFSEFLNASSTAETISDTYLAFFTDASATELKSEYQAMTDDELRAAMTTSAIPTGLQNEAIKVKNNTWDAWEKEFRVADYKIFSDANDWASYMQTMTWGVINNPTGVVAENGDVVYAVVGSDIPEGTTLTLEARKYYDVSNGATQSITLQKGLNALPVANDGSHIYVRYESDFGTVTKDNKASHPNVADYPALNIHVIGGQVHGYVNSAKHTDDDWVSMRESGLFWAEQTDLLGNCAQVRLQTDFATANGDRIIRLIDMYDWYVGNELDVMGVTAVPEEYKDLPDADLAYEDLYPKKVNNRLLCISKKDEGGNPYGSSYHIYVPGSGNYLYDNLKNKDGGSIWVFGHEWGHVNQGPINIAASNEASNNLYPNILANRGGYSTSRGWNVQELQRKMANERSVNASGTYESQFGVTNDNYLEKCGEYSWPRTVLSWDNIGKHFTPAQMFYQLYLYYHAAGHNPLFYPRLFNEMRKDPLRQNADGNKITGWSDYLHFAMKACDAAGENLEDFFDGWGFFVPVDNYFVECYSQWYITTTQEQIENALTYMRNYDKANESIIFIDDRAVVSYQADGVTPKVPFGTDNVENCKTDFAGAQYSAFNGEASQPDGLAYTTSTNADGNTVVTINTDVTGVTNAAGVKFYNADGKLVYFASQTAIEIPANLKNTVDLSKTVIALTDGTTMPLYNAADAAVFEQTIHHGDGTSTKRYTKGDDAAVLSAERDGANAFAVISGSAAEASALATATNVAVGTEFQRLELTDNAGFDGLEQTYTAKNINYKDRKVWDGWNTACFPFAVKAEDFGKGAKLEVLDLQSTTEDVLYFTEVTEVAAGRPCLIYVPDVIDNWTFSKSDESGAGIPIKGRPEVTEAGFYMNGSFTEKNIGAGHYKMNNSGTAFGITTAAGMIYPFRAYISTTQVQGAARLSVEHGGTATDITLPTLTPDNNRLYDLQGHRITTPKRGVPYILNGQKVIFK